ncbi:MAG: hypothetical protein AAF549_06970 [Pseudomonadota bacterium]
MSLREYTMIMFSNDLAMQTPEKQKEAVLKLWDYVSHRKNIWEKEKRDKMNKEFAPFFTGHIESYRQYADAMGILFQPEVYRGHLSRKDKKEARRLGFKLVSLNGPQ